PNPGSGYYQIGISSSDYDGDGLSDGYETIMRYGNPNSGPKTSPTLPDSEQPPDQLPDGWEVQYGLDPTSGASPNGGNDDPDGDGLSNKTEHDRYVFPNPAYDPLKPFSGPPRPIVT